MLLGIQVNGKQELFGEFDRISYQKITSSYQPGKEGSLDFRGLQGHRAYSQAVKEGDREEEGVDMEMYEVIIYSGLKSDRILSYNPMWIMNNSGDTVQRI